MTDAFVLGGVRTPVGRYAGSLSHIRTDDLLGLALNAAVERVGVERGDVEEIAASRSRQRFRTRRSWPNHPSHRPMAEERP